MPLNCCLADALQQQLSPSMLASAPAIWVALSGGLDSCVLLHRLNSWMPASQRSKLKALHVHHGLSPYADQWQAFCQQFCEELNIPLTAVAVSLDPSSSDSLEQQAREARYQVFTHQLGCDDLLLTAHHGDDQVETFFLRLLRGAGLAGLAAIATQRSHQHFNLVRPLLSVNRVDLQRYAEQQQLIWVEDESNQDRTFDRNWLRQALLPSLWQRFPGRKTSVLRSIEQLRQDQQLLASLIDEKLQHCQQPCYWPLTAERYLSLSALRQQPDIQQPHIIRRWLSGLNIPSPSAMQMQRIFAEILPAAIDKNPRLTLAGWNLQRFQDGLYCYRLPETCPVEMTVEMTLNADDDFSQSWHGGQIVCQSLANVPSEQTDAHGIVAGCYQLVSASQCRGQKLYPHGRPGKTLKHLWQEKQVPLWLRESWPCLCNEKGELVAVIGLMVSQQYSCASGWQLSWNR